MSDVYKKIEMQMEYYKIVKNYANHEDTLIGSRLNWILVISSFLFAGLGIATQAYDVLSRNIVFTICGIEFSIYFSLALLYSVLGISSAVSCYYGIRGAAKSLDRLENNWIDFKSDFDHLDSCVQRLPGILGAGEDRRKRPGTRYPQNVTFTILFGWFAVLLFNIAALFGGRPQSPASPAAYCSCSVPI